MIIFYTLIDTQRCVWYIEEYSFGVSNISLRFTLIQLKTRLKTTPPWWKRERHYSYIVATSDTKNDMLAIFQHVYTFGKGQSSTIYNSNRQLFGFCEDISVNNAPI